MVTHYGTGEDQVACGRNNHNLVSTRNPNGVSCKTCRSTESYRAAVAAPAVKPESQADIGRQLIASIRTATEHLHAEVQRTMSRKQAWEWRLTRLGPGNRLPRGFKQQPFTKQIWIMKDDCPQYLIGLPGHGRATKSEAEEDSKPDQ